MWSKKIGRFVVAVELAKKQEGALSLYDAVLMLEGRQVKIHSGCIGQKSGDYWAGKLEILARKLNILYSKRDSLAHNLLCYSESYLMDKAKEDFEGEWNQTKEELEFVEGWIKELEK